MRYIKYFEDIDTKLYKWIPTDDLGQFFYNDAISMSKENIDLLMPLLKEFNPEIQTVSQKPYIQCKSEHSGYPIYYKPSVKYIMELSDEYFYVSIRSSYESNPKIYKCDTIQGVLQLLKDNRCNEIY